jgi:hypothetical protein
LQITRASSKVLNIKKVAFEMIFVRLIVNEQGKDRRSTSTTLRKRFPFRFAKRTEKVVNSIIRAMFHGGYEGAGRRAMMLVPVA